MPHLANTTVGQVEENLPAFCREVGCDGGDSPTTHPRSSFCGTRAIGPSRPPMGQRGTCPTGAASRQHRPTSTFVPCVLWSTHCAVGSPPLQSRGRRSIQRTNAAEASTPSVGRAAQRGSACACAALGTAPARHGHLILNQLERAHELVRLHLPEREREVE